MNLNEAWADYLCRYGASFYSWQKYLKQQLEQKHMNEENNPNKIVLRLQVKLDAIADKKVREAIDNAMKPLWDLVRLYNIGRAETELKNKGGLSIDLSYTLHHAKETIIRTLTPRFREAEVSDFCTQISELSGKAEELKGMIEA